MIKEENGNVDTTQYCADCKYYKYIASFPYCSAPECRGESNTMSKNRSYGEPHVIRKEHPEMCPYYSVKRSLWFRLLKWLSE